MAKRSGVAKESSHTLLARAAKRTATYATSPCTTQSAEHCNSWTDARKAGGTAATQR